MPEYGREYWERHQVGRRLRPDQLVEIATGHLEREDARIMDARGVFLVDTNALTTAIFARDYHGAVDPRLAAIADACASRYDVVFLCGDEFPYQDTWDRSGPVNRARMQAMIADDLAARGVAFLRLEGPVEARARRVKDALARHRKWGRP
jgi:nicotinamide riboside kinase